MISLFVKFGLSKQQFKLGIWTCSAPKDFLVEFTYALEKSWWIVYFKDGWRIFCVLCEEMFHRANPCGKGMDSMVNVNLDGGFGYTAGGQFHTKYVIICGWVSTRIPSGMANGISWTSIFAIVVDPGWILQPSNFQLSITNEISIQQGWYDSRAIHLVCAHSVFICWRRHDREGIFRCLKWYSGARDQAGACKGVGSWCHWHQFCNLGIPVMVWQWTSFEGLCERSPCSRNRSCSSYWWHVSFHILSSWTSKVEFQ